MFAALKNIFRAADAAGEVKTEGVSLCEASLSPAPGGDLRRVLREPVSSELLRIAAEYRGIVRSLRESESRDPVPARYRFHRTAQLNELLLYACERSAPLRISTGDCDILPANCETFESLSALSAKAPVRIYLAGADERSPWRVIGSALPEAKVVEMELRERSVPFQHMVLAGDAACLYTAACANADGREPRIAAGREVAMRLCFNDPAAAARIAEVFAALEPRAVQAKSQAG